MADRKRGLGRGLSALMSDVREPDSNLDQRAQLSDNYVPIEQITPNPKQPRKRFAQDDLEDLATSIRDKGVIQPLIVRRRRDNAYEIVAGERRWRAAQLAQLHAVPVIVREFSDVEVLEVAIIENVQRADLNAYEEALGYRELMDQFNRTQSELASSLGKSRSHIANMVRLLTLPEPVIEFLRTGNLSAGHARALVTMDDPLSLARKIVNEGLSVREAETLAKKSFQVSGEEKPTKKANRVSEKDADTKALEGDLSASLGMKVTLSHKPGQQAGQLVVSYSSLDDLDELCRLLSGH